MALWLSACSVIPSTPILPSVQSDSTAENVTADPLVYQACAYPPSEMVSSCRSKGGLFVQQGRLGCYQCVLSYSDAGKVCKDSADCQGQCRSANGFVDPNAKNQTGQCASDSSVFGCYQVIQKGVAQPAICVD
ncbi:hypothetical protein [Psychrobacter sp. AOP7-B1-24]|uniref:hypothetical protein n=1 Tax=Psychrobacter sp. AOP7-B1-24 TaxID=3457645 RepID=UPI00402B46A1